VSRRCQLKNQPLRLLLGLTVVVAATAAAPAASEPRAAAGSFDFGAEFPLISTSVPCPADVPPNTTECRAHTVRSGSWLGSATWLGSNHFRGQGAISEVTYTLPLGMGPPTCPANLGKPLATTALLIVAGKGEIDFVLSEGARCVDYASAPYEPQEFAITGGTGPFSGASGRGKAVRFPEGTFGEGVPYWVEDGNWFEAWTGTMTAPEINRALPKLTGAVAKTVLAAKGARSARVTFEVTAVDDSGGAVPVSCWPRSGSRFPLGKTMVSCAATDASGNTATAEFTLTVTRRR
jgi:HYR domain